jgi:hypothetical protein
MQVEKRRGDDATKMREEEERGRLDTEAGVLGRFFLGGEVGVASERGKSESVKLRGRRKGRRTHL